MRRRQRPAGDTPPPPADSAWPAALRLLMRREYSAAELRRRLLARGYDEPTVENCVSRLQADGTLDDRRVAALHIRTAREIKGRGRLRIERELGQRGIDAAVVRELLAEIRPEDEAAQIARVLRRHRVPARPSLAERRRIFRHLLRRGFRADAISRALGSGEGDPEE